MSHACDGRNATCPRCVASSRRLDLVRVAMTAQDQLDDITRARIWSQLEGRLATGEPRRSRWPIAIGVAAVASAAAIAVVARPPHHDPHTLTVPVETTVTAQLGPHTRAAVVGPAELDVVGSPGTTTVVRLRSGTLLAEFAGGAGRALRIEAPGAVVDIVGTLFAVEVRDTGTCTSVARGKVRVTITEHAVELAAGQRYCTGGVVRPIANDIRDALARHAAAITAHAAAAKPTVTPILAAGDAVADPHDQPAGPRVDPPGPALRSRDHSDVEGASPAAAPDLRRSRPSQATTPRVPAADDRAAATLPREPATAEALYRAAEAALAARDPAAADRELATLVAAHPGSPLVDQALYDRARIAYQQRAWPAARRHLDRLAAISNTLLAEPGHYLACRIAVEARDRTAATCLTDYRRAFARSPHDLEALALLVQLRHAEAGCATAAALVDELVASYPHTGHAAAWRARCPERR